MWFSTFYSLAVIAPIVLATKKPSVSLPLSSRVVYQFPNPTWVENLAIRSGGDILVTILTAPELYSIDPQKPPSQTPILLQSFPSITSLTGISELEHDRFYVAGGNFSLSTLTPTPGSYSVWEVDVRGLSHRPGPRVRKVASIPDAVFLNGITALSKKDGTLLIADSVRGVVFKLNVKTGVSSIAIDIPEMKPPPPPALQIGVNGLKIQRGYLYFSNTGALNFWRVPINNEGTVTGSAEQLASGFLPDDFALDRKGNAYLSTNIENKVTVVLRNGTSVDVLGELDELTVAGSTATAFGRTNRDRETLYITTGGALASPVNGTITEGGKIVAADTRGIQDLC